MERGGSYDPPATIWGCRVAPLPSECAVMLPTILGLLSVMVVGALVVLIGWDRIFARRPGRGDLPVCPREQSRQLLDQGQEALVEGRAARAAILLEQALDLLDGIGDWERLVDGVVLLARAHEASGEAVAGIDLLRRVEGRLKAEGREALGVPLLLERARILRGMGNLQLAFSGYRRAARQFSARHDGAVAGMPGREWLVEAGVALIEARVRRARERFAEREWEASRQAWREALELVRDPVLGAVDASLGGGALDVLRAEVKAGLTAVQATLAEGDPARRHPESEARIPLAPPEAPTAEAETHSPEACAEGSGDRSPAPSPGA